MLKIRKVQIDSMETSYNVNLLRERILIHLPHIPASLNNEMSGDLYRRSILRSNQLGITTIEGCVPIVQILHAIGEEFFRFPDVLAVINDRSISPNIKFVRLLFEKSVYEWAALGSITKTFVERNQ